ncbi:MAG: cytochrome P450 [Rhodospirillales bacterium]|nr:cytochrome P450 [Rhodospirillales bacterium]
MSNQFNLGMFQSSPSEFKNADVTSASSCPVSKIATEFEPFGNSYIKNPYDFYQRARNEEPVFYDPKSDYWVVLKYTDIVEIFRNPEIFSAAIARHPVTELCPVAVEVRDKHNISIEPSLVDEDPETHKAHKKIFGDAFTPKRVNEIEPRIRRLVSGFIDRFIDKGSADLVSELLYEVPALAIFIFLGADDDKALMVKELGSVRSIVSWGKPTEDEQVDMMHDISKHWDFTKQLVDDALEAPGDNYLGDMARLHLSDPSKFTINYLCNVMFLMQFAGHETTTQASANGMRALLENYDQWRSLCKNPDLIPNAVEEILRYDSSIFAWRRITTRKTKVGKFEIPEGAKILMALGSGSRDSEIFEDGDNFDIFRKQKKKHLAFGNGVHFCMGAPLARLEMKIILEELTKRLPQMKMVKGQQWDYIPTLTFRGIKSLRVEWDANKT